MEEKKVISLFDKTEYETVDPVIVAICEDLLKHAKSGDLVAIAFAGIMNNEDIMKSCYTGRSGQYYTLLGAAYSLVHYMSNEEEHKE